HGVKLGTFRWLCQQYMLSVEYGNLDPRTQHVRRQIFDHMCAEPIAPGANETFGDCPLARLTSKAVRILRDRKAMFPEAANGRVKVIRAMFRWARDPSNEFQGIEANPARDVPFLKPRNKGGFHTWTVSEVERFEAKHPVGTKAHLALGLLVYTGARRSDVVLLGKQHVREGRLRFTVQKNRNRLPRIIDIPVLPELQAILDASPTGDMTFLLTEFGKPYTAAGFGNWFARQCHAAGLDQCSAHGLRKAAATIAAENGATTNQLMAIFGWGAGKEAERYTKTAERKRLATDATRLLVRSKHEQNSLTSNPQSPPVREKQAKS
ncbi:MAG TPA: tyrosine-type recombinase/integrase, partial [Hyphomicrobiaceae bacterium]